MNRPHIVVDESGGQFPPQLGLPGLILFPVGRIIRRQDPSLPEGSTIITTTPPAPPVTSDIPASISGVQRRLVLDPADANYQGTPGTTEQMIARIIQGGLDPQLLDELFDAEDYLAVLRVCPEPQRYIDGLYQVHRPSSGKCPSNLTLARFSATFPLIRQCVHGAFVRSGGGEGIWECFLPLTIFKINSSFKMSCRLLTADSQTFGKRTAQPVPLRSRSSV